VCKLFFKNPQKNPQDDNKTHNSRTTTFSVLLQLQELQQKEGQDHICPATAKQWKPTAVGKEFPKAKP